MKKRIPNAEDKYPIIIDMGTLDGKSRYLIGWPGYRTGFGKWGLDPVQNRAELAQMEGRVLRLMLLGKFRTHNPFYLMMLAFIGVFWGLLPLLGILVESLVEGNHAMWLLLLLEPSISIGILVAANVVLNLFDWETPSSTGD